MDSTTSQSAGFYELVAWAELHKNKLLMGAAALAVLVLAYTIYQWQQNQKETKASDALMAIHSSGGPAAASSPKAADYLKVANEFPGTPAGEHALLLAGADLYTQGKYQEAQTQFEKFLKEDGSSSLAPEAAFGVATCLDALNRVDEALARYQDIVAKYPTASVAAQAKLNLARLYEVKNQAKQALNTYDEMVLKEKPGTVWVAEAQAQRAALLQKHPELVQTNAPVVAVTNLSGAAKLPPAVNMTTNKMKTNPVSTPTK